MKSEKELREALQLFKLGFYRSATKQLLPKLKAEVQSAIDLVKRHNAN